MNKIGSYECGDTGFHLIKNSNIKQICLSVSKGSKNVTLAGDHLYGKWLFTWPSLVMSMILSFCAVLFPTRCLGWDLELN